MKLKKGLGKFISLIVYIILLLISIGLVSAVNVCVVIYYPDGTAENECVDVPENADGVEVLEAANFNLLLSPESQFGQLVCKINGVGTELDGNFCEFSGEFWNFVVRDGSKWGHSPVGLNGGDECWNRDFSFSDFTKIVHYCAKDGDLIGFAFGEGGAEPFMLEVKDLEAEVDGKRDSSAKEEGGSIDIQPGSKLEINVELENLYTSEISLDDVFIEATLFDIDDGDDLDFETNEKDISPGKDKTFDIDFDIPLQLDDDDYNLVLEIEARDEFGIDYMKELDFDVDVDKKKHEILMRNIELRPKELECKNTLAISIDFLNTGKEDEDVTVRISNDIIATEDFFELDENTETTRTYRFDIQNLVPGMHPVEIQVLYPGGEVTETVNLAIKECEESKSTETTVPKLVEKEIEKTDIPTGAVPVAVKQETNMPYLAFGLIGIGILISVVLLAVLIKRR